ncbi:hypothetical protein [Kosakonia sp. S42]|uniref:hypothetical protein n=1 Tax=Kosakonia sp. S42 TaxID=2767458 RepID=UPI001909534F|nr:hypothetical protein [Kosakonia sp. S42]MBK0019625.1 hypothetical protein [Kosakonia sp. S42]
MLISNIGGLNSGYLETNKKNKNTLFSEILEKAQQKKVEKVKDNIPTVGENSINDSNFKPLFKKGVFPSGQEYTTFNVADCLSENNKSYLKSMGWPTPEYSEVNNLASWIAFDRVNGTLTGSINKDYLFGSKEKGTIGLVDRLQGEGSEFKNLCETLLKLMGDSTQHNEDKLKESPSSLIIGINKNTQDI